MNALHARPCLRHGGRRILYMCVCVSLCERIVYLSLSLCPCHSSVCLSGLAWLDICLSVCLSQPLGSVFLPVYPPSSTGRPCHACIHPGGHKCIHPSIHCHQICGRFVDACHLSVCLSARAGRFKRMNEWMDEWPASAPGTFCHLLLLSVCSVVCACLCLVCECPQYYCVSPDYVYVCARVCVCVCVGVWVWREELPDVPTNGGRDTGR